VCSYAEYGTLGLTATPLNKLTMPRRCVFQLQIRGSSREHRLEFLMQRFDPCFKEPNSPHVWSSASVAAVQSAPTSRLSHSHRRPVATRIGSAHQDGTLRVAEDQLDFAIVDAGTTPRHTMPHGFQITYGGIRHLGLDA
jgi:hypothetical protein